MMRILVTGGSGFIGSRLVADLLDAGHVVTIFDKVTSYAFPSLVQIGDVRDLEQLKSAVRDQDAVFHLAAEHRDDVTPLSLYNDVNIGGAENLVKAIQETGCRRVIFTSSVAVYPLNCGTPSEEHDPEPFNPYGLSKLGAEKVFKQWIEQHPECSLTIVRPSVVFGERNRGNVYNLLQQISTGRFIMVGSGQNRKSMAYVGNIVHFLISRLNAGAGVHTFNYADKPDLTTSELVRLAKATLGHASAASRVRIPYPVGFVGGAAFDLLAKATGKKFPISSIRIRKFCADTTVAADRVDEVGFKRPYTLSEGITRMIESEFLSSEQKSPLFDGAGG